MTKIEWAYATVNFWWGCTAVSPACAHCYAETMSRMRSKLFFGRTVLWGKGQPRGERLVKAREEALSLNRKAAKAGVRFRVFANSMSDWLDDEVPIEWLASMLETIHLTPHLDWLLLTKRPENWAPRMQSIIVAKLDNCGASDWFTGESPPPHVHIGTTVEDQPRADERIPHLLKIPAAVRFLSCEPLLGPVVLPYQCHPCSLGDPSCCTNAEACAYCSIHQVIVGGESQSAKSRPTHPDWFRSLRDQCARAAVPFFFKQWGDWLPADQCEAAGISAVKGFKGHRFDDGTLMLRVGKAAAGRLLDGVLHEGLPGDGEAVMIMPINSQPSTLN